MRSMNDLTIEYDGEYNWWYLYEFSTYPRSSVLAGQTMKSYIGHYDTVEQAQAEYPSARVGYRDANNTFDHLPDEDMDANQEEQYWLDIQTRNSIDPLAY